MANKWQKHGTHCWARWSWAVKTQIQMFFFLHVFMILYVFFHLFLWLYEIPSVAVAWNWCKLPIWDEFHAQPAGGWQSSNIIEKKHPTSSNKIFLLNMNIAKNTGIHLLWLIMGGVCLLWFGGPWGGPKPVVSHGFPIQNDWSLNDFGVTHLRPPPRTSAYNYMSSGKSLPSGNLTWQATTNRPHSHGLT